MLERSQCPLYEEFIWTQQLLPSVFKLETQSCLCCKRFTAGSLFLVFSLFNVSGRLKHHSGIVTNQLYLVLCSRSDTRSCSLHACPVGPRLPDETNLQTPPCHHKQELRAPIRGNGTRCAVIPKVPTEVNTLTNSLTCPRIYLSTTYFLYKGSGYFCSL